VGRSAGDVYRDLAPAVLGYFRSHRIADAEDLTGDVFVKVTQNLARFRGSDAALRRWVFTIAHHRLVDEIRRLTRTAPPLLDESETVAHAEPLDDELIQAMSQLTEEQREVVVLRFVADLPVREVAKILGLRSGAVKMAQARGLAALESALGQRVG
jgi:RNA polymerase sigma factor (sigma-70 family)